MQFNLYVLALIVTLYSAGPTYAAQKADCSSLLTEAQAAVLRATVESTNHYTIKVLSKDIAGKNRVVVILGEGSHTKGQQDSDLGKQILNQFSVYGIESASPAATWGGRLIAWPASWARQQGWFRQRGPRDFLATLNADGKLHVRIRNRRYDDPRIGQPRAAGRMFYGSGQFASTIQEAYLKGRSRKQLLLSDLRGVFEKYELSKLTKESADRLIIEIGEREIKGSSVEQAIVDLENSLSDHPRVLNLEESHQPTLAENLGSIAIPAVLGACVVKLGFVLCDSGKAAVHATDLSGPEAMDALSTALAVGAGLTLATFGERILGSWDVPGLFLKYTRDLFLVNGRDVTMAERVNRSFAEEPELDSMLVIVGANHVAGLSKLLIGSHGFQDRSLPQESLKNE